MLLEQTEVILEKYCILAQSDIQGWYFSAKVSTKVLISVVALVLALAIIASIVLREMLSRMSLKETVA